MVRRSSRHLTKATTSQQEDKLTPKKRSRRYSKRHRKSSTSSNEESDVDTSQVETVKDSAPVTVVDTDKSDLQPTLHSPEHTQIDKSDGNEQNSVELKSQPVSSDQEEERETRKGSGKSKYKRKAKGERTSKFDESRGNAEICENVQISPELIKHDVVIDDSVSAPQAVAESNGDDSHRGEKNVGENNGRDENVQDVNASDYRAIDNSTDSVDGTKSDEVVVEEVLSEVVGEETISEIVIAEEAISEVVVAEETISEALVTEEAISEALVVEETASEVVVEDTATAVKVVSDEESTSPQRIEDDYQQEEQSSDRPQEIKDPETEDSSLSGDGHKDENETSDTHQVQSPKPEEQASPKHSPNEHRSNTPEPMDTSETPFKEHVSETMDTSFNVTASFNPDISEVVRNNEELQGMVSLVCDIVDVPKPKKRKWGGQFTEVFLKRVSSGTIKNLCPHIKFVSEEDVKLEVEKPERVFERKVSVNSNDSESGKRLAFQSYKEASDSEDAVKAEADNSNIIAMNRKISIVDDTASKMKPPPSPAKNPVSDVLFINNLVRPFTLKQLKELLERTGTIQENGFWTDRIKSKCYIHYTSIEEAEATRNALCGVQWPIGNGKQLQIDYATVDNLREAQNPPPQPPPVQQEQVGAKQSVQDEAVLLKTKPTEDSEERRLRTENHVRDWDRGKEDLHRKHSPDRERRGHSGERQRSRHLSSPGHDYPSRKPRKVEEEQPQKLMDDLFCKTKTTPSIYWLPLSPEEIATKQQQRLERMAEHKRRMDASKPGRGGDHGRGISYRRRYD